MGKSKTSSYQQWYRDLRDPDFAQSDGQSAYDQIIIFYKNMATDIVEIEKTGDLSDRQIAAHQSFARVSTTNPLAHALMLKGLRDLATDYYAKMPESIQDAMDLRPAEKLLKILANDLLQRQKPDMAGNRAALLDSYRADVVCAELLRQYCEKHKLQANDLSQVYNPDLLTLLNPRVNKSKPESVNHPPARDLHHQGILAYTRRR